MTTITSWRSYMAELLRPHQQQMLDYALDRRYALWYADMGTGKTLSALTYLAQFSGLKIVFCPKPALSVYLEDWNKFNLNNLYPNEQVIPLVKGTSKAKQKQINSLVGSRAIIVVNYETARLLSFAHIPFTAAVADEAQRIGRHNGKTSIRLAHEMAHVPHKVDMTGTVWHDGIEALFGMVRFPDPLIYDNSRKHPGAVPFGHWSDYTGSYCTTYTYNNIEIISGYKNLDKLAGVVHPFTLQIKADDVLDLPPVVSTRHLVPMSGKWKKAYQDLAQDAAVQVDGELAFAPHILQRVVRLQQIACSGVLETEGGGQVLFDIKERENMLEYILNQIDTRPVVIFTRFKRDVEIISRIVKEPVALLTGDKDNHEEWKAGKQRVLVANIAAGGVGVRLERAAHIIFWSVGWSHGDYRQALGRVRRLGQTADRVFFHHIITEGSIDAEIYDALQTKRDIQVQMDKALNPTP